MQRVYQRRLRLGHTMAVFGMFLTLVTLSLQGINSPKIVAFGTGEVASLSNQYRANSGLGALTYNAQLASSAQAKAAHMVNNNYFAHDAPDGSSPWDFIGNTGYAYISAGENLALTNQSAASVVDGWYNSPGHRANMLSSAYSEVGYGVAYTAVFTYNGVTYNDVYLVAAHYGQPYTAPAPSTPAPAPTPPTPEPTQTPTSSASETIPQETEIQPEPEEIPIAENPNSTKDNISIAARVEDNTSTSGTLETADESKPFRLGQNAAFAGLATGVTLVIAGSIIEIRRLMYHLPLIPHHK